MKRIKLRVRAETIRMLAAAEMTTANGGISGGFTRCNTCPISCGTNCTMCETCPTDQ